MLAALKARFWAWLFQLRGPESGAVTLVQRRVFILPTRHGLVFALTLALMLVGSINYTLSLGFMLTFLLAALGILAILHTFRNLAQLRVCAGKTPPVFAGSVAQFGLWLENRSRLHRYAIGLARDRRDAVYADVPARDTLPVQLPVPAVRRGVLRPGRLTVFTRYPLGLCYAWSYVELDASCIVYPQPEALHIPLPLTQPSPGSGVDYGEGQEDFAGLRAYHPGDSPRHIAWKAAARDQGLFTKQFSGKAEAELWLDWNELPRALGTEARLSRLARWVLDAHAAGLSFGLRLPGTTLPPAPGEGQRDRCLAALALYRHEDAAAGTA